MWYKEVCDRQEFFTVIDLISEQRWQIPDEDLSLEEGKKLIQELTSISFYMEFVVNLPKNSGGLTAPMIRSIFIDREIYQSAKNNDDGKIKYFIVLAHEYIHLTQLTADERYTNFQAFLTLYNSGNNYLRKTSLYFASSILSGSYPYEYDCSQYIIEYLLNENNNNK